MQRIIAHIDMNSYFASCEQQDNPAWRGKPLGVCEHLGGIIIAASVEAKRWGIKTGTPVWEAKKLYPKIILTKTSPHKYHFYTKRFLKVFEDYTDDLDKYSIDEAFLDLSKVCHIKMNTSPNPSLVRRGGDKVIPLLDKDPSRPSESRSERLDEVWADPYLEAERIAKEIKQRMVLEVGDWIRCSVGIANNKLLAKIASDMQKPDGLTTIRPENKHELYSKLALTDIPGIGSRMERRLNELGIKTLSDLRDYPLTKLTAAFGIPGYHLYNMGQLEGSYKEVFVDEPIKSIGHMYTVEKQYRKPESLQPLLYKLSEMVATRLRANNFSAGIIHAHFHDPEHNCYGRSKKLDYRITDGRDIFLESLAILKSLNLDIKKTPLYLLGVTVSGLRTTEGGQQQSLFWFETRKKAVTSALDKVNEKYGDFTLSRVPTMIAKDIIRDSVGFGRMKEFKKGTRFFGSH